MSLALSDEYQKQLVDNLTQLMHDALEKLGNSTKQYPEWMDSKLAAEYLGISRPTLSSWIKQGLPYSKIGTMSRFRKADLDGFLLQHSY